MNEITPDLTAKIATRLFNEIPAAGVVPTTESNLATCRRSRPGCRPDAGLRGRRRSFARQGSARLRPTAHAPPETRPTVCAHLSSESARRGFARREPAPRRVRRGDARAGRLFSGPSPIAEAHPPVRRGRDSQGLPHPAPAGPRKAVGVAGQRRHDPEAAERDRRGVAFYAQDNSNIHRGAHTLAARATDAFEQARQKVQAFLGARRPRKSFLSAEARKAST